MSNTQKINIRQDGAYDISYFYNRHKNRALKYRLKRRTAEVKLTIERYSSHPIENILDIGTADALMLQALSNELRGHVNYIGMDLSLDLLKVNRCAKINKIHADAQQIPVLSNTIDIAIATAIIEHIQDPDQLAIEVYRVLKKQGLFIITSPNPTIARISESIGLLKDSGHEEEFSIPQLCDLLNLYNFQVLEKKRFMFSPIGFPFEKYIERYLGPWGLNIVMANQLVVAKK